MRHRNHVLQQLNTASCSLLPHQEIQETDRKHLPSTASLSEFCLCAEKSCKTCRFLEREITIHHAPFLKVVKIINYKNILNYILFYIVRPSHGPILGRVAYTSSKLMNQYSRVSVVSKGEFSRKGHKLLGEIELKRLLRSPELLLQVTLRTGLNLSISQQPEAPLSCNQWS